MSKKKKAKKEIKKTDLEKFEEEIQNILDKHQFVGETRRKIFSQIMETALASRKAVQNDQDQQ